MLTASAVALKSDLPSLREQRSPSSEMLFHFDDEAAVIGPPLQPRPLTPAGEIGADGCVVTPLNFVPG